MKSTFLLMQLQLIMHFKCLIEDECVFCIYIHIKYIQGARARARAHAGARTNTHKVLV